MSTVSLRDYFAAHADVSQYNIAIRFEVENSRKPTMIELANLIADARYAEADAMLSAGY